MHEKILSVGEYFHKIEVTRSWIHVDAHHTDHILSGKPQTMHWLPCPLQPGHRWKVVFAESDFEQTEEVSKISSKVQFSIFSLELGDKV